MTRSVARRFALVGALIGSACASEPPPNVPPVTRASRLAPPGHSAAKTTLTREERAALDAELGAGFAKALDGNIARPYGPVSGPRRGEASGAVDVDYASLPAMAEARIDSARDAGAIRIAQSRSARPDRCAEGMAYVSWRIDGLGARPAVVHIDRFLLPPRDPTSGALANDSPGLEVLAGLGGLPAGARADWTTIAERDRSTTVAKVDRYEASFDPSSDVATAKRKLTASAPALVPGVVYAFRRCIKGCGEDLASPEREEEIELIGPPALWIGSSASTDRQLLPEGQPFTELSVPIAPGGSANLFLAVGRKEMGAFASAGGAPESTREARSGGAPVVSTFSLEVVWALGREPEATLFTGSQRGLPEDVIKLQRSSFYADCLPLR